MKKLFSIVILFFVASQITRAQISYQTTTIQKGGTFVAPFDINLMQQVNQKKQQDFNNNDGIIREHLKSVSKQLNYVKGNNRKILVEDYNDVVNLFNTADLSDTRTVRFMNDKLDNIEAWIDYIYQNPTYEIVRKQNP